MIGGNVCGGRVFVGSGFVPGHFFSFTLILCCVRKFGWLIMRHLPSTTMRWCDI